MGTGNSNEDKVYQEAVSWNPVNLKRRIHELHDGLLNEQRENARLRAELEETKRYYETAQAMYDNLAVRLMQSEARVREMEEAASDVYQVVGVLLDGAGMFTEAPGQNLLHLLSWMKGHDVDRPNVDILPFTLTNSEKE